jgi:TonB family protein
MGPPSGPPIPRWGNLVNNQVGSTVAHTFSKKALGWAAALLSTVCAVSTVMHAQAAPKGPHRKTLVRVEPEYPAVLKNGHFEGQVRLDATVLPNGTVSKVEVKGGNPMLCQFASQAVMRWKYVPASSETVEEVVFDFKPNR